MEKNLEAAEKRINLFGNKATKDCAKIHFLVGFKIYPGRKKIQVYSGVKIGGLILKTLKRSSFQ